MENPFDYSITSKNDYAIVTLKGAMNRESRSRLETLQQELLSCKERVHILNFKEVLSVDASVFRQLTLIQQDTRKEKKALFLTGMNYLVKQRLNEKGIIRISETKSSVEEVLKLRV